MANLIESFERNALTKKVEEKKHEVLKKEHVKSRDQEHLEMAFEWVRRKTNGSRFQSSSDLEKREMFANMEAIGRDGQHLELAYEWLRIRNKTMPLILKRRIWWETVPEATSYVVYVSKDKTIFEPSKFFHETTNGIISKEVKEKMELIIPDEWPEFPMEPGTYYIGITARDRAGNESDPLLLEGKFRFFAPSAPEKVGIEIL